MLNFILRRTWLKSLTKEEQDMCLTLRWYLIISCFVETMLAIIMMIPQILVALKIIECAIKKDENIIWMLVGILMIIYSLLCLYIIKNYNSKIIEFKKLAFSKLYFYLLTFKGNAISFKDWKTIKEFDKGLYKTIMEQRAKGYCYAVCFHFLKCLKKGKLKFIAVLIPEGDGRPTIHVLYVNNGWCFDTYSQRQYRLEKVMKIYKAIEYKEFSYSDIEGKIYEEFKHEQYPALKEWCIENNIYENWMG